MLWNNQKLKNFQQAHQLYQEGKNKTEISKILGIRRPTIIEWLKRKEYQSKRGWTKGEARKYSDDNTADRICKLKKKRNKEKYFTGSDYVRMDYSNKYPDESVPNTSYIDRVVRQAGLQSKKRKPKKSNGGSEYLLYPIQSIRNLPGIHQSGDFVGKKYIVGSPDPVNIFSTSYYWPFKLYQIYRTLAETTACAIECLTNLWQVFPIPNVFRMDSALQFRGTGRGKRVIGKFLKFLLNLNITPLFSSPSKPWTNPHIEGHNRVFNEKVWSKNWFTELKQIDKECQKFNQESQELLKFKYAQLMVNSNFDYLEPGREVITDKLETIKSKKIYFTRFVESFDQNQTAHIVILNETVRLPVKYTHQFVFVEWDLEKGVLLIYSEFKKVITLIKQIKFRLNI